MIRDWAILTRPSPPSQQIFCFCEWFKLESFFFPPCFSSLKISAFSKRSHGRNEVVKCTRFTPPFSWQASMACHGTKRAGRWARANRLMTKRTLLNPILVRGRGCTWGLELHRRPPVTLWWSIGPDLARGHWRQAGRWMAREREKEGGRAECENEVEVVRCGSCLESW